MDVLPALLAGLFGALLGASEIISRYRDEPLRATFNQYGITYLAGNAIVSLSAFMLVARYSQQLLPKTIDAKDGILVAFITGFGAMLILRSKLFSYRTTDGKEIPVGPDLVADRFLNLIDRKIDRQRAAAREQLIFALMHKYTNFGNAAEFFRVSLGSFQNLSEEEKKYYADQAEKLQALKMSDALKAMALGFLFLDISGEENLKDICGVLDTHLAQIVAGAGLPVGALGVPATAAPPKAQMPPAGAGEPPLQQP